MNSYHYFKRQNYRYNPYPNGPRFPVTSQYYPQSVKLSEWVVPPTRAQMARLKEQRTNGSYSFGPLQITRHVSNSAPYRFNKRAFKEEEEQFGSLKKLKDADYGAENKPSHIKPGYLDRNGNNIQSHPYFKYEGAAGDYSTEIGDDSIDIPDLQIDDDDVELKKPEDTVQEADSSDPQDQGTLEKEENDASLVLNDPAPVLEAQEAPEGPKTPKTKPTPFLFNPTMIKKEIFEEEEFNPTAPNPEEIQIVWDQQYPDDAPTSLEAILQSLGASGSRKSEDSSMEKGLKSLQNGLKKLNEWREEKKERMEEYQDAFEGYMGKVPKKQPRSKKLSAEMEEARHQRGRTLRPRKKVQYSE